MPERRRGGADRRDLTVETGPASITPAQLEVLRLVSEGHGNKAIAERIGKSENDVKAIVSRLLASLHASNRAELARIAVRLDVIGQSDLQPQEIQELLQRSPVLTALLRGPDHRFVFANEAYAAMARELGFGELELIGRRFSDAFPSATGELERLDRVYTTGVAERVRAPIVVTTGDDAPRALDLAFVEIPVRDEAGSVTAIAFFGLDLRNPVGARS